MADDAYRQIVRSSSIMGGAQVVKYAVGLLQVKVIAVLLGPAGVGVIGLYNSANNLLGAITGLGINSSAVRDIAEANGAGDPQAVARKAWTLRRLCWLTGALGWLCSMALALPISHLMFKSSEHAWALAALGAVLFLNAVSGGQSALLQGVRRIGDIACLQIGAAVINAALAIGLYLWLRERGIVPVLIGCAAVSLGFSWYFSRRVPLPSVQVGWSDAFRHARPMVVLGLAMMSSAVLTTGMDMFTRTLITRDWGVEAAGIYDAAWALSGVFAGFVLAAMSVDYYPRLTGLINHHDDAIREVNQQTEIGVLLALPGLLFILAYSDWIILLLYSDKFSAADSVLLWLTFGVFGRILSWPQAFVQLAKRATFIYFGTELFFIAIQAIAVIILVPHHGPLGAAYAFAGLYVLYTLGMSIVSYRLIGFVWSTNLIRVIIYSCGLIAIELLIKTIFSGFLALLASGVLVALAGIWCLRELISRLGSDTKLSKLFSMFPGLRAFIFDSRNRGH